VKNKKTKFLSAVLVLFLVSVVAVPAIAAVKTGTKAGPEKMSDVVDLVKTIAGWFQAIVLAIAIFVIIYAGLTWMTAGGDEEKLGKARKMLIYGVVGIGVALFAYAAQALITNLLGGGT